jgi:peptidoglycan/xylan/chitin deacetylase (PgdA/CDA1 family)
VVEWWPLQHSNAEIQHPDRPAVTADEAFQPAPAADIAHALDEIQKHKAYFAKRSVLLLVVQQQQQQQQQQPTTATTALPGDNINTKNAAGDECSKRQQVLVPLQILRIQHATDVTVILEALRSTQNTANNIMMVSPTHVDRTRVEQDIATGHALWVPPNRTLLHQWLLKRAMDLVFHRTTVEYFSAGPYRRASLCDFNVRQYPCVRNHVALTLDDAPGRFCGVTNCCSSSSSSVLEEVRLLLKQYNAKATFMMVGSFLRAAVQHPQVENVLIRLLQDGHEFGNHGGTDQPHHCMASDADFVATVNDCSQQIRLLQEKARATTTNATTTVGVGVHYFRAPHGKYTKRMHKLLNEQCQGLTNVMCDVYASDPIVHDGTYLARSMTRQARHGSILLLHMPEALGFRSHCLVALRGLLEGLTQQRQMRVVSVGMLEALAQRQ